VIRGYGSAREHLDDVIELVTKLLERHRRAGLSDDEQALREVAELELEVVQREDRIAERLEATRVPLPFRQVCERFALSTTEARVLAVLVAIELASSVREATVAALGGDTRSTATIGLVEGLVYRRPHMRELCVAELGADARLFGHRLAELGGSNDLPWLVRPIRAAPRVLELALGRLRLALEVVPAATLVAEPPAGHGLLVAPETRALVHDALGAQAVGFGFGPVPLLIGAEGSGRGSLVFDAANALGKPVLVVRASALPRDGAEVVALLRAIAREAILFDAVLLVRELDTLAGEPERNIPDLTLAVANTLGGHIGFVAVTAVRGVWPASCARSAMQIEIAPPSEAERAILWRRVLPTEAEALADEAASRYHVTGGLIERAAAAARARATARQTPLGLDDVRVAIRGLLERDIATMGRRVEWRQTWSDLVLPNDIIDELVELVSRVRNRKRVLDDWGFGRKVGKGTGVSALFSGPPGTGKTMVAGLLAAELGLDLYQVDVSRMVSKWIGETEKNLARLFDAAAAGHAVLLFDEADSLFAKRTDVKSSNDRYANLEVNYLLQRMESFEGISILTTNLESAVDDAFKRRLAFRIAFPLPEVEERERLWRAMMPSEAEVAPAIDFCSLARRFEMSGGYIRNAVLRAAYLAAADNMPITDRHMQRAAALEYTAMGKIVHSSL